MQGYKDLVSDVRVHRIQITQSSSPSRVHAGSQCSPFIPVKLGLDLNLGSQILLRDTEIVQLNEMRSNFKINTIKWQKLKDMSKTHVFQRNTRQIQRTAESAYDMCWMFLMGPSRYSPFHSAKVNISLNISLGWTSIYYQIWPLNCVLKKTKNIVTSMLSLLLPNPVGSKANNIMIWENPSVQIFFYLLTLLIILFSKPTFMIAKWLSTLSLGASIIF